MRITWFVTLSKWVHTAWHRLTTCYVLSVLVIRVEKCLKVILKRAISLSECSQWWQLNQMNILHTLWAETFSLSLLQAVDPSGEGSATRVLFLHSAQFLASSTLSCRSSMLCLMTSIHLFLCLPLLRCPPTFASKICLTQSSSSRRCTCPYHLSLASCTLSVIHAILQGCDGCHHFFSCLSR